MELENVKVEGWDAPERRVEVPQNQRLVEADAQTLQTMQEIEEDPLIEFYAELNDETDYALPNADGSITRVSEPIFINGVRYLVVPGKNKLPKSVYEIYINRYRQRDLMPPIRTGVSLGNFS